MDDDTMLTTYDNPFNPFEDFEMWMKYDILVLGHNTCGLLARTALISPIYSDEVNDKEIDRAMDEIIAQEPLVYKKVTRDSYPATV